MHSYSQRRRKEIKCNTEKKKYRFAPRGVISNLKLEGKDTSASGSCKALNPITSLAELPSWYKHNIKAHPQTHLGLTCAMSTA